MRIAKVRTVPEYTKFGGGLDLKTPTMSVSPGALMAGMNYEAGTDGGYMRIDGYERYDGRTSPSAGTYYYCPVSLTATVSVDDTITGVTSSATGVVIVAGGAYLCVSKVTGTFAAENITVGGSPVGAISVTPSLAGETTGPLHATALNLAASLYRSDISAPTGSGALRGLGLLKGTLYSFRDNAGGTAGLIYKATSSGWSEITLYHEISFNTGLESIADGTAITQTVSAAEGTVKRTVLESGAWDDSDGVGRLIISVDDGTFDATGEIQVSSVTKMTATSLATEITIDPGGRYETLEHNFYASLDTKRMYGCDGVNRGFEFDGSVYVPIDTGMTTDTPEYCKVHKKQLCFSFKGSSQNSGPGFPYEWTAVSGSAETALGDDITGYVSLPGKALGILARNLSEQLIGNNSDDWKLDSISDEVGCIPRTAQKIGYAFCMDDRGIISITPSDKYGNFEQNTISRLVQPLINNMRKVVVASTVYKTRNQYRLYGSDGSGVCMTILNEGVAFTQFQYPDNVACVISGEDSTGKDVVFFGDDAGMVYQADKGSSFDGEEIESYIRLPFNNSKSPSLKKTYKKATIEMSAEVYTQLKFLPDFSYGDENIPAHVSSTVEAQGAGGYWDIDNWDEIFYDASIVAEPSFRIEGAGKNLGLIVYSTSATDLGHKLDGAIIHYIPRRLER